MMKRMLIPMLCLLLLTSTASANSELGGLRVATSSGTFLKIGISPRGEAMGGAWTSIASDATAAWYNPAGLAQLGTGQVFAGYTAWPADIRYTNLVVAVPSSLLHGTIAVQVGNLFTTMDETDEYHPYGTGRSFTYSDLVLGVSYARSMTAQLQVGGTVKYVREDFGSSIGGPVTNSLVIDVGTLYHLAFANMRIGMCIQNFGSELTPSGSYWNHVEEKNEEFEGFPPPSNFKLGLAYELWLSYPWLLTQSVEMNHLSDNRETLTSGLEMLYGGGLLAFRAGYNLLSDEMGLSAGFGANFLVGTALAGLDYSFTDGNSLGAIHRWAFRVDF
ncbi:MAG: PorV/PorQ family protein [bacterium]|nr:PorV/PorQ family protein [bacterium]